MKEYLNFPQLRNNDHIRILCTARIASENKLAPAIEWLKGLGYRVSLGKTVGLQHHQYGGSDKERLDDFMAALKDPDVNAIWIARGGYGTIKIVDHIDMSVLNGGNKLLMGYSDVTHLHTLWQKHGLQSMHTFMPQEFTEKPEDVLKSWHRASVGRFQMLQIENNLLYKRTSITAPLIGGNLSVLVSALGSSTFPDLEGHILFIEDLDELLYHIDRLMTALHRAGKLNGLAAIIVGGMSDMRDHEIPFGKTAQEIIQEHTAAFDYPVVFGFPSGHIKNNNSFILGRSTTIIIDSKTITISQ